jgi:hypothetical protein
MFRQLAIAATAAFSMASAVSAAIPVYGAPGTEAAQVATYTAPFAGDVTGWFLFRDAGFNSEVGVGINGGAPVYYGLTNSLAQGTQVGLGSVAAGDVIRFYLNVTTTGNVFSTDVSENSDGFNHAWHTPYAGGDFGVPASLVIGWEDILGGGDKDYNDNVFAFRFPGAPNGGVPEPATWALLIAGFGMVGLALRRRPRLQSVTA